MDINTHHCKQINQQSAVSSNSGFTLIELLISLVLMSGIVIAIYSIQEIGLKQQEYTINAYLSTETANQNVQILSKQIRNARNGDNGTYVLESVDDQSLIFYSNIDNDPDVERVRVFLDETNLKQGITDPTSYPVSYPAGDEIITTISQNVRNDASPIFYYYNAEYPEDTTNNPLPDNSNRLLDTRAIGIALIINSNPNYLEADYRLESISQVRMLKDNL